MGTPSNWHRRHAITLASQLPDNVEDAVLVLQAAQELVETFLIKAQGHKTVELVANVVPFLEIRQLGDIQAYSGGPHRFVAVVAAHLSHANQSESPCTR